MNDRFPLTLDYGETCTMVEAGGASAMLINQALVGAVGAYTPAAHSAMRMQRNDIEFADAPLPTAGCPVANAVVDQGAQRISTTFGVGYRPSLWPQPIGRREQEGWCMEPDIGKPMS